MFTLKIKLPAGRVISKIRSSITVALLMMVAFSKIQQLFLKWQFNNHEWMSGKYLCSL